MSDIEVSVDCVQLLLISVRVDDHVVKHGVLGPLIHLAVGFPDLQVQARHLDPSLVQVLGILCERIKDLQAYIRLELLAASCFIHLSDISRVESTDELLGRYRSVLSLRGFLGLRFMLGDRGPLLFLFLDLSVEGKVFKEVFFNLQRIS